MKANELMIGDWVIDSYGNHSKIQQIYCVENILHKRCYLVEHNKCSSYVEQLEPIPLTEEILKSNGWEVMGKEIGMVRCLYRLSDKERIRIYLHYPYMLHYVDDTRTDGYEECEWSIGNITKVHELQHALRLCGLNELADNFKI